MKATPSPGHVGFSTEQLTSWPLNPIRATSGKASEGRRSEAYPRECTLHWPTGGQSVHRVFVIPSCFSSYDLAVKGATMPPFHTQDIASFPKLIMQG